MGLVYILRHGNTFDKGEIVRRVGGRTDLPLSVSGHMQAESLASHFSHIEFARVFASPLKRQHETAQAIVKAQKSSLVIEPLECLREVDYGPDENKPESEVIARIGAAAMSQWDTHGLAPDGWQIDPAAIRKDWADLFNSLRTTTKPVLVVTSNGTARFIFDIAEPVSGITRKLHTGAYGVVKLGGEKLGDNRPQIISWDIRPN